MKFTPLVALRSSLCVLGLARAELSKVLCCLGRDVRSQSHLDAAQGLSWTGMISGIDAMLKRGQVT